jgi:hypothetical protein
VRKQNKRIQHLGHNPVAELFGWCGTAAVLGSYALLSLGIVDSNSIVYHVIFLTGSAGLAVITYRHRAFQSFVVNIVFIVLTLIALTRIVFFA